MSWNPSNSLNYPYEPEPYPLLRRPDPYAHMTDWEITALFDTLARKYGGAGYINWNTIDGSWGPEERQR